MSEIKCPHCGKVFSVNESDYESIVSQIKSKEFDEELNKRIEELHKRYEMDSKLQAAELEAKKNDEINKLNESIKDLKNKIESSDKDKTLAITEANANKEKEISKLKEELNQLKAKLDSSDKQKELDIKDVEARLKEELHKKDEVINKLNGELKVKDSEAKEELTRELSKKNEEINKLSSALNVKDTENALKIKSIEEQKEALLKAKQEELEYYKDLKTKMSTKLVGETLEQHCQIEFNKIRTTAFPNAYFEKDNDSKTGSKGDFIYRECDANGVEIISIMFEMKNENDTTATKHKNEDFFKELDKDRCEKKCEYAVLVTMLEADSDYYNAGIVDVSYRYPKMFVVRPQCFISIISLLRQAALNALQYKQELAIAKNQSIDITNFEERLSEFKDKFGKNYDTAKNKFDAAITSIDKSIADLQKVKDALLSSGNQLRLANEKAQEISIKKLTRGNETMKKMFEDVNNKKLEENN